MKFNFILPGIGITGGGRVVFEYANRLTNRGHDVTILYPTVPPRFEETLASPMVRVSQAKCALHSLLRNPDADWFDLNPAVELIRIPALTPWTVSYLQTCVPDADVTIATSWETAYAVDKLDNSKGEKVYFVQHYEIWDTWNSNDAWQRLANRTSDTRRYSIEMADITPSDSRIRRQKELVDQSYKLPLTKITVSEWLANLLESKFNEDVVSVIPNSVNRETFYPTNTPETDVLQVLIPYRDTAWKGQHEAQKLVGVLSKRKDVDVHTYGSGSTEDIPETVQHHTDVSDEKLRQLYARADVFALTTWVEGFGLPPLEAMACRSAVISTTVGAVPDYAQDGENAILVPPRDGEAMVDGVQELLRNAQKRNQLQKRGYQAVQAYTWDDATQRFEATVEKIMA